MFCVLAFLKALSGEGWRKVAAPAAFPRVQLA
jgi:hypothetical protein